jgi:hypothetical protein
VSKDGPAVAAELPAVVDQTIQPTQASLWLRPPTAPRQCSERSTGTTSDRSLVAPWSF